MRGRTVPLCGVVVGVVVGLVAGVVAGVVVGVGVIVGDEEKPGEHHREHRLMMYSVAVVMVSVLNI